MEHLQRETSLGRLAHLDMLRGVAALLVMAGHLRAFMFQSFGSLSPEQAGVIVKSFYFATGLGSHAVFAFFALSGFLVGGKTLSDLTRGRFTWQSYILRRLTRLWIVIIPALAFTALFDMIGVYLTGNAGYDGRYYDVFTSGPKMPEGADHRVTTLLGNLAFVQTIWVPVFGSNGPLWSLANEFWYYVVFPLAAWAALVPAAAVTRLFVLSIFALVLCALPLWLWEGGMVWLGGAGAAWATTKPRLGVVLRHPAIRLVAIGAFLAVPVLAKVADWSPVWLGFAITAVLPVLALMPHPGGLYAHAARWSSEISFTLYLTHFPLMMLLVLVALGPGRMAPDAAGAGVYLAIMALTVGWAAVMWWCFERNTDRLYADIRAAFSPRRRIA